MVPYTTNPNPDPTPNNHPDPEPIDDPNPTPYNDPDLMDDDTLLETLLDGTESNDDFNLDDSLPIHEINLDDIYHTGTTPLNTNHDNTNATTDQEQHESTMQHAPNISESSTLILSTQEHSNPTNTNTPDSNQVINNLQGKTDSLDITPPNTNNHDIINTTTDNNQQENTMQHALSVGKASNYNPSTQNNNNQTNTNTPDSNQAIPPHLLTPFRIIYALKIKLNKLKTNLEQLQEHKATKTLPPGLHIHHRSKLYMNKELSTRWENTLFDASLALLDITIDHHKQCIQDIQHKLQHRTDHLKSKCNRHSTTTFRQN